MLQSTPAEANHERQKLRATGSGLEGFKLNRLWSRGFRGFGGLLGAFGGLWGLALGV